MNELLIILEQFGAGGRSEPANNVVRFLLAAFFWTVLVVVAGQQYRRQGLRRDLYVAIAAAVGLSRELSMFVLEYGAWRGLVPTILSYRVFPPLEHALTDLGRVLLGFAYLRYFIPGPAHAGRTFLRVGSAVVLALYLATAPLWIRFLDARPHLYGGVGVEFALFRGDIAFRVAGCLLMGTVLLRLGLRRWKGAPVPLPVFGGFAFLFLDESLMLLNIGLGFDRWNELIQPIRHNLSIWAIPLFLFSYWTELFRQLREEKATAERNLAERRKTEEALRESEERYRALVENVDIGITLIDDRYRIVMVNAAHARLFGQPPSHFSGRPCHEAFRKRDTVCPGCHGTLAMAAGKPVRRDSEGIREDGSRFASRIQAFPLLGADGTPRGFVEVVEDVTEARKADENRRKLEERILQTQKLESLGILAGGIAHDFNNLLVSMLGNVDLALSRIPADSPARPFLDRVDAAAQRAADLTNQMLAYSGKGKFVVDPVSLSRLVEEMGHLLKTVISKRAFLKFDLAGNLPPVIADATQVRQVVMNLITNASDAIGDRDGVITVTTGVQEVDPDYLPGTWPGAPLSGGLYAFVEVADNGCGMDRETLGRIFDPFFTTKHTGRGLGLAAALGIVRSHHGGLRVYSEPGRGTTFKVLLPAADAAAAGPSPAPGATPAEGPLAPETHPLVLVADDEPTVRDVAREMLEHAGFRVLAVADGVEAVAACRGARGDLAAVVLDMTMPRMGGEEAFRELRRIDPDVPVILTSGYNEAEAVTGFIGRGLAGFIQKPYRAQALVRKVREAIERGPGRNTGTHVS